MTRYSRPQRFRRRVFFWLNDDAYELAEKWLGEARADRFIDWFEPWVERPTVKALCSLFRHEPISECSIPDHDFCAYCRKGMPGQSPESKRDAERNRA